MNLDHVDLSKLRVELLTQERIDKSRFHIAHARYSKWWMGRYIRRAGGRGEYKKVTSIETQGNLSMTKSLVTIGFEDGSTETMSRPKKADFDVSQ